MLHFPHLKFQITVACMLYSALPGEVCGAAAMRPSAVSDEPIDSSAISARG